MTSLGSSYLVHSTARKKKYRLALDTFQKQQHGHY